MQVKVHMLAFQPEYCIRTVTLPPQKPTETPYEQKKFENLLDWVFHWGQNDNQPVPKICSVSCGDVVESPTGDLWLCCMVGWKKLTTEQFEEYKKMPRVNRQFCDLMKHD